MIIRPGKFEATVFCSLLIFISFISAVTYESGSTAAMLPSKTVELPVVMYHHITENESKAGKYTILTRELENDLRLIKEKGYTAITVKELIDFVKHGASLPEKPIMITFDDGFESFYTLAFPVLKKYNVKAVVSVIGSVTERYSQIDDHNVNYSNLNFDEITQLSKSGLVEIQNHSYDMHGNEPGKRKGMSKLNSESDTEYAKALTADLETAQKILTENCGIKPTAVVYPYGAYSKQTLEIVKDCGFECTMHCEEKINTITCGNADCLYGIGRYNRESGVTSEEFFKGLLKTQ